MINTEERMLLMKTQETFGLTEKEVTTLEERAQDKFLSLARYVGALLRKELDENPNMRELGRYLAGN